jgi:hypothetical protein
MIITIKKTESFLNFLSEKKIEGDYRYKYLNTLLNGISSRKYEVDERSYVHQANGGWIVHIRTDGQLFFYGENYTDIHISHFVRNNNVKEFRAFEIMGTRELVYAILQRFRVDDFTTIKDRYFYRLTEYKTEPSQEGIEAAVPVDLGELVTMHQHYYQEEYKGERNKTAEYLSPGIAHSIAEGSMFVLKKDGIIISYCSLIDPDIGIIFTKEAYRCQGFGRRLLEYCSRLLFEENGVAYLMTDMHNSASNFICQMIGYKVIYEHTNVRL